MTVESLEAANIRGEPALLTPDDERYPPLLGAIHDPPPELYVRGDPAALLRPQIAIVGSRKASPAALRLAHLLASQLSQVGLCVCSGLALGIDGAAHRGAIAAGGSSVAVMATGIDRLYPSRHRQLATELEGSGCLITEFPPGTPPRRNNFPQRNRIISGLSLGVVVVEAALRSGSLITARTALEQGREVFALPWSMLHEGGAGCLQLLRDGAKMVQSVDDIVEELGPLYRLAHEPEQQPEGLAGAALQASSVSSALLALVGYEACSLDELVRNSGQDVAEVQQALSLMELAGEIARTPGGFIRC